MTREMNKPDWHNNWVQGKRAKDEEKEVRERILNPDIEEFFRNCCKFEKMGGNRHDVEMDK